MQLLKRFKWGPGFYQLNQEVLDSYAACMTSADVIEAQRKWMEKLQEEDAQRSNTDLMDLDMEKETCNLNRQPRYSDSESEDSSEDCEEEDASKGEDSEDEDADDKEESEDDDGADDDAEDQDVMDEEQPQNEEGDTEDKMDETKARSIKEKDSNIPRKSLDNPADGDAVDVESGTIQKQQDDLQNKHIDSDLNKQTTSLSELMEERTDGKDEKLRSDKLKEGLPELITQLAERSEGMDDIGESLKCISITKE